MDEKITTRNKIEKKDVTHGEKGLRKGGKKP